MAEFEPAFDFLMSHEDSQRSGVVTSEPNGGKARFGINSIAHPEADTDGFYDIPADQALVYAASVARGDYWMLIGGYNLADQTIANKFLDLAFNMGVGQAVRIVQRASNSLHDPKNQLQVDGCAGAFTIAAINAADPDLLLAAIKSYATQFYEDIARRNSNDAPYLAGWLKRVNA